jgi:Sec-independent protein secretion pathway component TatC
MVTALHPNNSGRNMCLFAAPMIALYVITIGVACLVNSARERRTDVV